MNQEGRRTDQQNWKNRRQNTPQSDYKIEENDWKRLTPRERIAEMISGNSFTAGGLLGFSLVMEKYLKSLSNHQNPEIRRQWGQNVAKLKNLFLTGDISNELRGHRTGNQISENMRCITDNMPTDLQDPDMAQISEVLKIAERVNLMTEKIRFQVEENQRPFSTLRERIKNERLPKLSAFIYVEDPGLMNEINEFCLIVGHILAIHETGKNGKEGDKDNWLKSIEGLKTIIAKAEVFTRESRKEISGHLLTNMANILQYMPRNPTKNELEMMRSISKSTIAIRDLAARLINGNVRKNQKTRLMVAN